MTDEEIKEYWRTAYCNEEHEREELEESLEKLQKSTFNMIDERNNRITDLEKENAELKTNYNVLSCSVGDFGELQEKLEEEQRKNNGLEDQLTKAKELLRFWVNNFYDSFNNSNRYEERHKALKQSEQFLKEIEQ